MYSDTGVGDLAAVEIELLFRGKSLDDQLTVAEALNTHDPCLLANAECPQH